MIYYDFKNKMIKFIFLLFYVKQITNENTTLIIKSFYFIISKTGNERYSDASFITDLYVLRKNSKFNPLT